MMFLLTFLLFKKIYLKPDYLLQTAYTTNKEFKSPLNAMVT